MKKVISILSFCILSIYHLSAQKISFGVKAGVNQVTLNGELDFESLTSFHAGITSEFFITDKFSVQPELVYSNQGASSEAFTESPFLFTFDSQSDFKLSYLNIPILSKFYITKNLSIEGGPQFGLLLSAKEEVLLNVHRENNIRTFERENDVKERFKTIDLALALGINYKWIKGFDMGLRYNLGLSNVFETDPDLQNRVLQAYIGYRFFKL